MEPFACIEADMLGSKNVVLFDFDGTVANTQPAIFRVVREVLSQRGYDCTDDELLPLIGPPLEEGIRLVCDIDAPGALEVVREYRDVFERTVTADEIPLFPGVHDVLDRLRAQGRLLAIATSRLEVSASSLIDALGVTQFDAVAGRVPGIRYSKSESILAALSMLGASPKDAVMVGDRKYDVIGAAEVGIPCVGLYSGAAEDGELEGAGAVAICRSMGEVGALLGI